MKLLRQVAQYLSRREMSAIELAGLLLALNLSVPWWQSLLIYIASTFAAYIVREVSK